MYRLTLENEFHSQIELTGQEDKWQVTNVTGLNPPPAVISTSVIPNFDGERFNASRLDKRNIVIRPLAYVRESETARFARIREYPVTSKGLCGAGENLKRQEIKALMKSWDRES